MRGNMQRYRRVRLLTDILTTSLMFCKLNFICMRLSNCTVARVMNISMFNSGSKVCFLGLFCSCCIRRMTLVCQFSSENINT